MQSLSIIRWFRSGETLQYLCSYTKILQMMCKECWGKESNMVWASDCMTNSISAKMCNPLWRTVLTSELWQGILLYVFSDTGSNVNIFKHVSSMASSLNSAFVMVTDFVMWRWLSVSDGFRFLYKLLNLIFPSKWSLWLGHEADYSPQSSGGLYLRSTMCLYGMHMNNVTFTLCEIYLWRC